MPNPFDDDDDESQTDVESNQNLVDVREAARRFERKLKAREKELEAATARLAELEAEKLTESIKATAKARGLSDEQVGGLLKLKPQATSEDVEEFAKMVGVQQTPATSESETSEVSEVEEAPTAPVSTNFSPVSGTAPPATKPTMADVRAAIARNDHAYLARLAAEAVRNPAYLSAIENIELAE